MVTVSPVQVALRRLIKVGCVGAVVAAALFGSMVWPPVAPLIGVVATALLGLMGSNFLRDRGFPSSLSRRIAPAVGGLAYLMSVLWLDRWTSLCVSVGMTILLIVLRVGFRDRLRGVKGAHSAQQWAEITYPIAGTMSLAIGWCILGDRWLGFTPIAFMAWGDTASGLARETVSSDRSPTLLTMLAMLAVCLVAAAIFFRPFWVGAVGAVAATIIERYRPGIPGFRDDNIYIVTAALLVMGGLASIVGSA
jgi:hypothetical protein